MLLMVRQEERILERCIAAARDAVDDMVVIDTGSSDGTPDKARALGCKVAEHKWLNFGHNRTLSLEAAKGLTECEWALVLDADMKLVCPDPARLREYLRQCTDAGCTLLQINGGTEYRNIRLMRMSEPWACKGVTHEYWACRGGSISNVPREVAYIEDLGDGGCKQDKFERDEKLLRDDLQRDPNNERSFFYLANTLQCEGKLEEAQEYYKKRIEAGGWEQERYFSAYQLCKICYRVGKRADAEYWAQVAQEFDPQRIEALVFLVQQLRERGEHYKAWQYLLKADVPKPEDKLFLETEAYEGRVAYERSIVHYYVSQDRAQGMRYLLEALPKHGHAIANMRFYAQQLPGLRERKYFPEPEGFWAGSVAVNREGVACVRTADYWIEDNGGWYRWRSNKVTTRNFRSRYCFATRSFAGFDEVVNPPPLRDSEVVGMEDLRLVGDLFTATQKQWTPEGSNNRMAVGRFSTMQFTVCESPTGQCEKNWLHLPDARLIYSWSPMTIGSIVGTKLRAEEAHSTPAWWQLLRGSAPPFRVRGRWLAVAHVVVPKAPREYFSVLAELEPPTWRPVAYSLPFYFLAPGVE